MSLRERLWIETVKVSFISLWATENPLATGVSAAVWNDASNVSIITKKFHQCYHCNRNSNRGVQGLASSQRYCVSSWPFRPLAVHLLGFLRRTNEMFFTVYKFTSVLYCKSVSLMLIIRPGSEEGSITHHNAGNWSDTEHRTTPTFGIIRYGRRRSISWLLTCILFLKLENVSI